MNKSVNNLFYKIKDKEFPKMGSWWVLVLDTARRLTEYRQFKSSGLNENVKILKKIERKKIIWPEDKRLDIKVSQWANGKHYYATVGKYDVVDIDGNVKWNTAKRAKEEAESFKKKM